nr:hypothetical protein GCM10020241_53740 [Streptoalloteichus tenebrarius]
MRRFLPQGAPGGQKGAPGGQKEEVGVRLADDVRTAPRHLQSGRERGSPNPARR